MLPQPGARRHGHTVLDDHGDLAASVIDRVPMHRTNDAIVFDAAAADHVVPFSNFGMFRRLRCARSGSCFAFVRWLTSFLPGNLVIPHPPLIDVCHRNHADIRDIEQSKQLVGLFLPILATIPEHQTRHCAYTAEPSE